MKGVIFRGLEALVIEKCGMAAWDDLLEKNAPEGRVLYFCRKLSR